MRLLVAVIALLNITTVHASPLTYICNYDSYSNKDGRHKIEKRFVLTFIVDKSNEKAYIVGNNGSEKVSLIPESSGGVSFIEITPSGNVMSTAIDINGNSVHSRNTSLAGVLVPSQYYGDCKEK